MHLVGAELKRELIQRVDINNIDPILGEKRLTVIPSSIGFVSQISGQLDAGMHPFLEI